MNDVDKTFYGTLFGFLLGMVLVMAIYYMPANFDAVCKQAFALAHTTQDTVMIVRKTECTLESLR